jgi:hypothetical protein
MFVIHSTTTRINGYMQNAFKVNTHFCIRVNKKAKINMQKFIVSTPGSTVYSWICRMTGVVFQCKFNTQHLCAKMIFHILLSEEHSKRQHILLQYNNLLSAQKHIDVFSKLFEITRWANFYITVSVLALIEECKHYNDRLLSSTELRIRLNTVVDLRLTN